MFFVCEFKWIENITETNSVCCFALGMAIARIAIRQLLLGAWFNRKLGGHTGDTYGAVVEWTEALLLCVLTGLVSG